MVFFSNGRPESVAESTHDGMLLLREAPQPDIEHPPLSPEIIYNLFPVVAAEAARPPRTLPVIIGPEDRFETIIVSDMHVGGVESLFDDVRALVRLTQPDHAIIDGDFIDDWLIGSEGSTRLFRQSVERLREDSPRTKYVYIPGNHDDLFRHNPQLANAGSHDGHFVIRQETVLPMPDGTLALVLHGDIFDPTVSNRKLGVKATQVNSRLNNIDVVVGRVTAAIGMASIVPIHEARRRVEGWQCAPVEKGAFEHLFKLNMDIYAWNLVNPEKKVPYYSHIICGHTHHAANTENFSPLDFARRVPMGPSQVSYKNVGCWVGPAYRKIGNERWRDRALYPVCTFYGVKKGGEAGFYTFHPERGVLPLKDQADNGHFLNPAGDQARYNARMRATPKNDRQRRFN